MGSWHNPSHIDVSVLCPLGLSLVSSISALQSKYGNLNCIPEYLWRVAEELCYLPIVDYSIMEYSTIAGAFTETRKS